MSSHGFKANQKARLKYGFDWPTFMGYYLNAQMRTIDVESLSPKIIIVLFLFGAVGFINVFRFCSQKS
jgi:hypothetical protein